MKIKTSITLSNDVLKAIDNLLERTQNRSEFIEMVIRTYIHQKLHEEQNLKDIEILNNHADYLNKEAQDVLEYQVKI